MEEESSHFLPLSHLIQKVLRPQSQEMTERLEELRQMFAHAGDEGHQHIHVHELKQAFSKFSEKLLAHLKEKETELFYQISHLEDPAKSNSHIVRSSSHSLQEVIKKIQQEHENLAKLLIELRELTYHYQFPERAPKIYKAIFRKLHILEKLFLEHSHIELKILIPRSLELESVLQQQD